MHTKEALGLSEVETPLKIEARFRARLMGKVHRYREATLRETLERCARDLGRVPLSSSSSSGASVSSN